tara:strand:+ start:648 stop:824 length:177 start_codon:yes stop_codon:yes gene_type:complete
MIAYCPLEDLEPRQQEVVTSVPQKEVPEIGAEDTELNYVILAFIVGVVMLAVSDATKK